jgi:hypothetical protein
VDLNEVITGGHNGHFAANQTRQRREMLRQFLEDVDDNFASEVIYLVRHLARTEVRGICHS